ncbi:hypothetical protein [Dongia sp. agr-C8]
MSDLFNPISRNLPGTSTGPNVMSGVVPDPPRSLLGLVTGTILKGTVLGKGSDGLTTIATDKGTVSVATNAAIPAGSQVTLEVRNAGGDRLQVLILAVEAGNRNAEKAHQAGSGSAGGASSAATAQSGAAGAAAHKSKAEPAPRPAAPPPIQIAGSSVKAVVVQAPPAASLLPTPDVEIEPFTAPNPPIAAPPDAAQKAQILAQARALVEPPTTTPVPTGPILAPVDPDRPSPLPQGTTQPSATLPASPQPSPAVPAASPPQAGGVPASTVLVTAVAQPGSGATILQPDVATRIAALFAAADAAETVPLPKGATPLPAGTPLPGNLPAGSMPIANVPPGSVPASSVPPGSIPAAHVPPGAMPMPLASGAGPLLAQFLAGSTTAAATTPALPTMLTAGSELTLHVVAVLPTKGGEIEIAPEAARLTGSAVPLIGKVLGYTRAGHAVIDTPAGALMMQERTRLPVGAQVALVLEPIAPPAAAPLPPITSPQQALLYLSNRWPALDDLIAVLRGVPVGTSHDPETPPPPGIPQTGPRLAAGLAAAIGAYRSGEIERLLQPMLAGRKLPIEKEEMVKRLREEFTQLSDLAKDRPAVDWRALFLPVYDPRVGLTQINLYYRHNSGGEGSEPDKKDQGTRFLVDVNFAALGAFQLDGLIRGRRFDLMIRSRSRLSRNQRQDIINIFENALEVGGATGALEFRTVEVFPVSPLDELRQSRDGLTA